MLVAWTEYQITASLSGSCSVSHGLFQYEESDFKKNIKVWKKIFHMVVLPHVAPSSNMCYVLSPSIQPAEIITDPVRQPDTEIVHLIKQYRCKCQITINNICQDQFKLHQNKLYRTQEASG